MPAPAPPYALDAPAFRLRALTAITARAPLGGERESLLVCLVAARLAAGCLPPVSLSLAERATRARSARTWMTTVALPSAVREALRQLVEASAQENPATIGIAVRALAAACAKLLDSSAAAELELLARSLTPDSGPSRET